MRIQEIMSTTVHSVPPTLAAEEAWEVMHTKGVRHLVVKEGSQVVGVLSESDAGGRSGAAVRSGARVADLMDRHVVRVGPSDTLRRAANLMRGHLIGCLPVVDRQRLVGVVTIADILNVVGGGADRPSHEKRAALHHRVAHRRSRAATDRW
jgi:CBS domain-containing protein